MPASVADSGQLQQRQDEAFEVHLATLNTSARAIRERAKKLKNTEGWTRDAIEAEYHDYQNESFLAGVGRIAYTGLRYVLYIALGLGYLLPRPRFYRLRDKQLWITNEDVVALGLGDENNTPLSPAQYQRLHQFSDEHASPVEVSAASMSSIRLSPTLWPKSLHELVKVIADWIHAFFTKTSGAEDGVAVAAVGPGTPVPAVVSAAVPAAASAASTPVVVSPAPAPAAPTPIPTTPSSSSSTPALPSHTRPASASDATARYSGTRRMLSILGPASSTLPLASSLSRLSSAASDEDKMKQLWQRLLGLFAHECRPRADKEHHIRCAHYLLWCDFLRGVVERIQQDVMMPGETTTFIAVQSSAMVVSGNPEPLSEKYFKDLETFIKQYLDKNEEMLRDDKMNPELLSRLPEHQANFSSLLGFIGQLKKLRQELLSSRALTPDEKQTAGELYTENRGEYYALGYKAGEIFNNGNAINTTFFLQGLQELRKINDKTEQHLQDTRLSRNAIEDNLQKIAKCHQQMAQDRQQMAQAHQQMAQAHQQMAQARQQMAQDLQQIACNLTALRQEQKVLVQGITDLSQMIQEMIQTHQKTLEETRQVREDYSQMRREMEQERLASEARMAQYEALRHKNRDRTVDSPSPSALVDQAFSSTQVSGVSVTDSHVTSAPPQDLQKAPGGLSPSPSLGST
jgi:septal ring factor EnvC (AmiA/AmiB activator)